MLDFRIIDIACCTLVVNTWTLWFKVISAIVYKYSLCIAIRRYKTDALDMAFFG